MTVKIFKIKITAHLLRRSIVWSVWVIDSRFIQKSKHFVCDCKKHQTDNFVQNGIYVSFSSICHLIYGNKVYMRCNKVAINDQFYWFWNGNHTFEMWTAMLAQSRQLLHHLFQKLFLFAQNVTNVSCFFLILVSFDCCWSIA